MKQLHAGVGALFLGALALAPSAQVATPHRDEPRVVVGTFDSRAILMAYVRSEVFSEYLATQKRDVDRLLEKAKTFGDEELARDLEALGPAMQHRIHQQGFGTAPVDDILARIEAEIPAVAEETGVDLIVSKWQLTYQRPGAQLVDVTERLAARFHPSEETTKAIRKLVETPPVPLDQIEEEH